ncbi:unnamed protein product [Didymodactylos carnosus]|uniref:Wee1-like protein kinase n=1 Tax=Didymodactylos carnosus TaxID=1234261 RepID=A0A813NMP9_9BILA|nr:unnamed protein product [Didymodactylos carnosus]CAF1053504.1 unnamed protein product [Didymodactylos carnosus]CAF3520571.1 unnamed protein product [Didymodactylos carnosus]CAF3819982.1 unnamed protein product [Didymodactylos carnosus]
MNTPSFMLKPRKLIFDDDDDDPYDGNMNDSKSPSTSTTHLIMTVRHQQTTSTPISKHTNRSLSKRHRQNGESNHLITTALARLSTRTPPTSRCLVITTTTETPITKNRKQSLHQYHKSVDHLLLGRNIKRVKLNTSSHSTPLSSSTINSTPRSNRRGCNVNPFASNTFSEAKQPQKRKRSIKLPTNDEENSENFQCKKKLALKQCNVTRFNEEFHVHSLLGSGEFGDVYLCVHRLDGCTYAIKRSKKPIAGSCFELLAWKEVCAHAVLGKHPNIVQYFSAWAELDHMLIQNEYCNGGNLAERIRENYHRHCSMSEKKLKQIILHIADGLKFIHSKNLVHLDIKPDNIFICINELFKDDFAECDENITYKIGDLGHVTDIYDPLVEEGDSRYLAREVLQQQFQCLSKADVFSLGLTVFVAGANCDLPKYGDEWDKIRNGILPKLSHCSDEFNDLILNMISPNVNKRLSSSQLADNPIISPIAQRSKDELFDELKEEQRKNSILAKKLLQYMNRANELEKVCLKIQSFDMNNNSRHSQQSKSSLHRSYSASDLINC